MAGTKKYTTEEERRAARKRSKAEYYQRNRTRERAKARERAHNVTARKKLERAQREEQQKHKREDVRRTWVPRTFALTGGEFQFSDLKSLQTLHTCLVADFALSPSTAAEWQVLTLAAIEISEMPEKDRKVHISKLMGVHTMRIDFVSRIAAAAETEASLRGDEKHAKLFKQIYWDSLTATICELEICSAAKAGGLRQEYTSRHLEWQT